MLKVILMVNSIKSDRRVSVILNCDLTEVCGKLKNLVSLNLIVELVRSGKNLGKRTLDC